MNEIWKDIPNYEGLYQSSNFGKIKSLDRFNYKGHHNLERILKPTLCKNGYLYVNLCKDKKVKAFAVHKLVALSFLKNEQKYKCVNHKDGNKLNNNVNNLEWCNHSYNEKEAYRLGLKRTIPTNQFTSDGKFIKTFLSRADAAREFGINPTDILRVCRGERKKAGGYIWRYADEKEMMKCTMR